MLKLLITLQSFLARPERDDEGAAMVEYGLLVSFIAVVVGVAAATLGTDIAALYTRVAGSM